MDLEPYIYLKEWKVLICPEHKCGVQPRDILRHLTEFHRADLIIDARRSLAERVISNCELLDPSDIRTPSPGLPPIPHLEITEGFICTLEGCNNQKHAISLCRKTLTRHRNRVHEYYHSRDETGIRPVFLQVFFKQKSNRWFVVDPSLAPASAPARAASGPASGAAATSVAENPITF